MLRSANAQTGESVAEFFPRIGLTALLGKVSPELSAFTLGGANAWGFAATASGPLFEGGRLVGQYRQARAARDEALLAFQQTALTALRDVSDALISRERFGEGRDQRARQVTALEKAVKLSSERYVAGKASYYEVLEAQQQLFPAELDLARRGGDAAERSREAERTYAALVEPSLGMARRVGNSYTASLYLCLAWLASLRGRELPGREVGLFSYGSGCCAEFFTGRFAAEAAEAAARIGAVELLDARRALSVDEYERCARSAVGEPPTTDGAGTFFFAGVRDDKRHYARSASAAAA
jgi:hypothetical protein